ncbi:bi-domain-containing oxidoreductase [Chitinophagaceae bacterium LB-8]|uniref:Bi-domain-containing oxidoreductase n=1 Tax=Paraflavisolibacter caeni TaxID=2982496 RepID=A0A9X2XYB5_9BACT|nr:bi-domain-containing oxidoreductase [Paraflavisolibacter caeni]MCU7550847.1 bi-domain-containing oxidoreductase [Paraflavisolibacter caeni]
MSKVSFLKAIIIIKETRKMKQVIQNFKTGKLYVDEVPLPSISKGMVLVENKFSLISAGTERSTVKVAKASLLGKAKQRPDLVAQVLQNIKKEGLKATFQKVQTKLDTLKALGYSTAGQVVASMDSNHYFKPGDRVACAGQDYASHAEIVSVPQNLVVKIPDNVSYEEASFTTIGAIALQGVRQADPKLGEIVCVIGLGLLGQLTCQLLKANGCKVMGIDFAEGLVQLAKGSGTDEAILRNDPDLRSKVSNFTNGFGFDNIIITAAAASNDPIELSAEIARKKGKVIVVGAVQLHVPRDPHFYRKELDLRMSCSYGPGRYDVTYEENGSDYPYAYVRWTEQRNMEAFLQLISQRKVNIQPLITHTFNIEDAETAYEIVMGEKQEHHIGILLHYPENKEKFATKFAIKSKPVQQINIGFIGAGSFAQSYLIPNIKGHGASLDTVVTSKGITANNVAQKFGFNFASSNSEDVLSKPEINAVFIATPHNSHAQYVLKALQMGKHVFVEKPLAMTEEELEEINEYCLQNGRNVMVGFNRRFSPIAEELKKVFHNTVEPVVMNYRVNAGIIPKEHWTQNERIGGGRIVGEVCHFVDLMQFFTGALPQTVYAQCLNTHNEQIKNEDNIVITITFSDGSVGTIVYVANGDKSLPKERMEIFGGGKVGIINDFRGGELFSGNKSKLLKLEGKGHAQEVQRFLEAVKHGKDYPIPIESIYATTKATFKILDSLHTGLPQKL